MAYKCYQITNLINGKSYIGKTKHAIEYRFYQKIDKDLIERVRSVKLASKKRKKVTENDVIDIIEDFCNEKSLTQIATERNLSVSNVFSIVWRDTFCEVKITQKLADKLQMRLCKVAKRSKRKLENQWPQERSNKDS